MKNNSNSTGARKFSTVEALKRLLSEIKGLNPKSVDKFVEDVKTVEEANEKALEAKKAKEERRLAREAERAAEREHAREVTSMDLPLDFENAFFGDERAAGVTCESAADGLILSLNTLGRVDIEYIAEITGLEMKRVISELRGSIFQNPDTWGECFYKGWETREEYLSGNLIRKWRAAKEANRTYHGYFRENVKALEAAMPEPPTHEDVYVTLGSPWVPCQIIDEFICYILNLKKGLYTHTRHDELTGTWELPGKTDMEWRSSVRAKSVYGTQRIGAMHIIERTLNMRVISVTDEVPCPRSTSKKKTKRVVNEAETVMALEKQEKIIREFQSWVWLDEKRRDKLLEIYEEKYGCVHKRTFDGSFLTFPTLSPAVSLYPYQKDAVARIIFSPNTLLAHDVGSGKTYIMIAAGAELRRMGLSRKNLYVVPGNIVGQWCDIYKAMYPSAKILKVDPKSFTPARRLETLIKIRDEEYDAIIMAHSCFERISVSDEHFIAELDEAKRELDSLIVNGKRNTSKLSKKRAEIAKKLSSLVLLAKGASDDVYFDELGITRLFIDEAHAYKNLPLETKSSNVLGICAAGSKKCQDVMDKVRVVQKQNNGGGVIFATGTPITNSITDAFVMQKYLQNGELALLDLQSFDAWVGMFAETHTEFEVDVDTTSYRLATRFSRFHNLPELTALLASIADFHQVDESDGIPVCEGTRDAVVGKTPEFEDYLKNISRRAEEVRSGQVPRTEDNMLKITTDGRRAALDLRLVDPKQPLSYQSKVMRLVDNVVDIYNASASVKGTQLIFCDSSTPKKGFNMYDEVKNHLIIRGIPAHEIAFVHDAESERARSALFASVRSGAVRVILGSTFKMGTGVNIQDRVVALHHLDIPWRPADMTQRIGRMLRQGNMNDRVFMYRYITEGSFDAYSWQLLETKARFICDLLSGSITERSASDIEDVVLDYAEIKALAVGNPLIKRRIEVQNEITRQTSLRKKANEARLRLEGELAALPANIERQREIVKHCKEDAVAYAEYRKNNPLRKDELEMEERRILRHEIAEALRENVMEIEERRLTEYCGFDIILPSNMDEHRPYVWLSREGRYFVELGESEGGILVRIDNFLDGFAKHYERLNEGLKSLRARKKHIEEELLKPETYSERLEELEAELDEIDKKLGVNR